MMNTPAQFWSCLLGIWISGYIWYSASGFGFVPTPPASLV